MRAVTRRVRIAAVAGAAASAAVAAAAMLAGAGDAQAAGLRSTNNRADNAVRVTYCKQMPGPNNRDMAMLFDTVRPSMVNGGPPVA